MMKIIVAYDGSEQSGRALNVLAKFGLANVEVLIVTVLSGLALDAEGNPIEPDEIELRQALDLLGQAQAFLASNAVGHAQTEILVGDPKDVIVKKAKEIKADLIITGSRGQGLARQLVFGSVSTAILHDADCPIMVVK